MIAWGLVARVAWLQLRVVSLGRFYARCASGSGADFVLLKATALYFNNSSAATNPIPVAMFLGVHLASSALRPAIVRVLREA